MAKGFGITIKGIDKLNRLRLGLENAIDVHIINDLKELCEKELKNLKTELPTGKWTTKQKVSKRWQELKDGAGNIPGKDLFEATLNYMKSLSVDYKKEKNRHYIKIGVMPKKTGAKSMSPTFKKEKNGDLVLKRMSLHKLDEYIQNSGMAFWGKFFDHLYAKVTIDLGIIVDRRFYQANRRVK